MGCSDYWLDKNVPTPASVGSHCGGAPPGHLRATGITLAASCNPGVGDLAHPFARLWRKTDLAEVLAHQAIREDLSRGCGVQRNWPPVIHRWLTLV